MTLSTIERNITVMKRKGHVARVSMSYNAYKKLRDAFISQEIYNDPVTQDAVKRAKEDIKAGRIRKFKTVAELVRSLDK